MDNVIDIATHRRTPSTDDQAVCTCGSAWFTLRRRPTDPDNVDHGAVSLTASGSISGYVGEPHCLECGVPWAPTQGWLAY